MYPLLSQKTVNTIISHTKITISTNKLININFPYPKNSTNQILDYDDCNSILNSCLAYKYLQKDKYHEQKGPMFSLDGISEM